MPDGAWLGLHATSGLLSPLTAAIGATLGMNLALLLHDLYRPTPATAQPTHPAPIQPSTPRSR